MEARPDTPDPPVPATSRAAIADEAPAVERLDVPFGEMLCPPHVVCITLFDSAVVVGKGGDWDHAWALGANAEAIEAGLQYLATVEDLTGLQAGCELVEVAPKLFGFSEAGIAVAIGGRSTRHPPAITADQANARVVGTALRVMRALDPDAAYTLDTLPAEWSQWFSPAMVAAMTDPTVTPTRVRMAVYSTEDLPGRSAIESGVEIYVAYAPTGSRVYLLDRSYTRKSAKAARKIRDGSSRALATMLRSIGIAEVQFDVRDACRIPAQLGGRAWLPLWPLPFDAKPVPRGE